MVTIQAKQKLMRLGQSKLLEHPSIARDSKKLSVQIENIDEELFFAQQNQIQIKQYDQHLHEPFENFIRSETIVNPHLGLQLMQKGQVGCIIMAGGQGSRLRFNGPKGCFPISIIKQKSLFQIFAEKVYAASKMAGVSIPLAIMTSPTNNLAIHSFFVGNNFFGLDPDQIAFFEQNELPLLDLSGDLFLETADSLACGPNGNGRTLHHFYYSKIWQKWQQQGVSTVSLIPIDNPLADPFDQKLFHFHLNEKNAITLKATHRTDPFEKVGVFVMIEKKIHVIEYTELSTDEKIACDAKGNLKFGCANLSLFCFDMQFIENLVINSARLPLHHAKKSALMLNDSGKSFLPEELNAWKFEEYIFDLLPLAQKVKAIVYPREDIFAPLKNFKGTDSIETVQLALQNSDIQTFCRVSGVTQAAVESSKPFELSQSFYYPTEEFLQKWTKKQLPKAAGYIEG